MPIDRSNRYEIKTNYKFDRTGIFKKSIESKNKYSKKSRKGNKINVRNIYK